MGTGSRITFSVDTTAARQTLANAITALRRGGVSPGPMRDAYARITARYLGFIRTRFVNASRGDGTWKPLAKSTKLKRLRMIAPARLRQFIKVTPGRNRTEQLANLLNSRPFPILRDTSMLFGSLTAGAPGNVVAYAADGVSVGTAVRYAGFHQFGGSIPGRPPQRAFLVAPDAATEAAIAAEIEGAVMEVLDEIAPKAA